MNRIIEKDNKSWAYFLKVAGDKLISVLIPFPEDFIYERQVTIKGETLYWMPDETVPITESFKNWLKDNEIVVDLDRCVFFVEENTNIAKQIQYHFAVEQIKKNEK
jgi:hypothetical protein